MAKIIGIDLGTTNSVVADHGGRSAQGADQLARAAGSRRRSSRLPKRASGWSARSAKHQQVTNPKNTVFSIKRFMGRRHSEVAPGREDGPLRNRRRRRTSS